MKYIAIEDYIINIDNINHVRYGNVFNQPSTCGLFINFSGGPNDHADVNEIFIEDWSTQEFIDLIDDPINITSI